jgi:hypothetical protein
LCALAGHSLGQGLLTTEVSYQGRLTDGGLTPTGLYDLRFRLFDDPAAGAQVGLTAFEDNVQVTGGLFTASPDFGADAFSASKQLWVQVEVRPGASGGAFTPMLPRQRMLSAPVASSLRMPLVMNTDPGTLNMFDLSRTGNGRVMQLGQDSPGSGFHALRVDGNSDAEAFGAYGSGPQGAIYSQSSSETDPTVTVINTAATGTSGVDVSIIGDTTGVVINRSNSAALKPGISVDLGSTAAGVLGGQFTLSGKAGADAAAVKGEVTGASSSSSSAGVWGTNTSGVGVVARSGSGNGVDSLTATGLYSIFGVNSGGSFGTGGIIDSATSNTGDAGVLGWNRSNTGSGYGVWAFTQSPTAITLRAERTSGTGTSPTIYATNPSSTSSALGVHSVMTNTTGGSSSTALRGESLSTGAGGIGVWGSHAGTGWGVYGTAGAGGYGVRGSAGTDANDDGWAGFFIGQVYVSSQLGIGVTTPAFPIEHSSGARLTAGGVWTNASDKNLKENITPVDPSAMLERVAAMPISAWNYKVEGKDVQHIGPMAQDFKNAFGLGDSDKVIATVDADGVALAAIQGLNKKLDAKDAELATLKEENAKNAARIKALEEAIAKLAQPKEGGR